MTITCNIHTDIKRGLHPVHILKKYHLTVRELAAVIGTMSGNEWTCESPKERGWSWWKAYHEKKLTLTFVPKRLISGAYPRVSVST